MDKQKIVTVFSGGLDSTVLLYYLRDRGYDPIALSFQYGQRNDRELAAATWICSRGPQRFPWHLVDLTALAPLLAGGGNALMAATGGAVPTGNYGDPTMKAMVVPNRNMIFLSIAAAYAISLGTDLVAYGPHAHVVNPTQPVYPDCRPEFTAAMHAALGWATDPPVRLLTPFIHLDKSDLVRIGMTLQAPLDWTYSCYVGGPQHCGQCGTCTERREAFAVAGVPDPTAYYHPEPVGFTPDAVQQ